MKNTPAAARAASGQDASPQVGKGHGHTEISNELLEAVYAYPWRTGIGLRAVLWILRDSYGWKRKETRALSFPEIADLLRERRVSVFKAFRSLVQQNVVAKGPSGGWVLIKNYRAWGRTPELPGLSTELSTIVDNSLPTGNGCLQATKPRCLQATKSDMNGNGRLPTGNAYKVKEKERKKERGTAPQLLPNQKNDTPKARAELGHPDFPPHDHPDFKRLGFKIQEQLAEDWDKRRLADAAKNTCRRCRTRPRVSDLWRICRSCTACARCEKTANNKGVRFVMVGEEIFCEACSKGEKL